MLKSPQHSNHPKNRIKIIDLRNFSFRLLTFQRKAIGVVVPGMDVAIVKANI